MKTQFDLYQSASAAALAVLDKEQPFDIEESLLATFKAEGQAPADWQWWRMTVDERRNYFLALRRQKAPSAVGEAPAA